MEKRARRKPPVFTRSDAGSEAGKERGGQWKKYSSDAKKRRDCWKKRNIRWTNAKGKKTRGKSHPEMNGGFTGKRVLKKAHRQTVEGTTTNGLRETSKKKIPNPRSGHVGTKLK